jgi:hypothetical protein
MTVVLWILAFGAVLVGLTGIPDAVWGHHDLFGAWLSGVLPAQGREETALEFGVAGAIAASVSLASITVAWLLYGGGLSARVRGLVAALPGLYKLLAGKYYVDELYDVLVVRPFRWIAFLLWKAIDAFVIDLLLVNGVGYFVAGVGSLVKYLQTGVQRYVVAVLAGAAVIIYCTAHGAVSAGVRFDAHATGRTVELAAGVLDPPAQGLDYHVDWGDGQSTDSRSPSMRHTYASGGEMTITLHVTDPRWDTQTKHSRKVEVEP